MLWDLLCWWRVAVLGQCIWFTMFRWPIVLWPGPSVKTRPECECVLVVAGILDLPQDLACM